MTKRLFALFSILCVLTGCRYAPPTSTTAHTQTTPTEEAKEESANPTQAEWEDTVPTDPAEDMVDYTNLWTPLCEEYIYLRESADSSSIIGKIPVGAELTLLEWHGKYALVTYDDTQGYVSANYIQPKDPQYFEKRLQVVSPTSKYTYEQMLLDMKTLQVMYPQLIQLSFIGKSEAGLDIPVMIVGNPDAPNHILMQGAMHAREHFTAWLLMAIIDNSLLAGLLDDRVCYHIIPMSNPDGVILSQTQALNGVQKEIYKHDVAYGYTSASISRYAEQWKSNGLGIDLNRNFPSGWEGSLEHPKPSSSHYRGENPLCAAESKALADYTQSRSFSATLSFHSSGSVLYYRYGNKQPVNDLSYELALAVQAKTGYIPVWYDGTTGAGYKDWAMDALGIPSLTIEIGSYQTPLAEKDIYNTFSRFEHFLPALSVWLAS